VLPTVSSLKALREVAKGSHESERYIGFGDPLLGEEDLLLAKSAAEKGCVVSQAKQARDKPHQTKAAVKRGPEGLADSAGLKSWAALPETADELCAVAQALGVDPATHIYLGARATESNVKRLSSDGELTKYQIVHFATHGATADQESGTSEPGLLLTVPDKPSDADDGYLSASEVATLKLDADWVILSACNTAAGSARSDEALSGLARAFFFAGARSLLVSHWVVDSTAAVKLITKTVENLKASPKIGRAEALRRSMLSMIANGKDYEAHPAFWAPFVLVGEGGTER